MHVVEVSHAKAAIRIKDGCLNVSRNVSMTLRQLRNEFSVAG